MKGLLYKDFLSIVKHYRTYFLLCLVFMVVSWFSPENLFYSLYPCVLIGSILVGLVALDENSKWNTTCGFLPFTQELLVGVKYLMGLILTGLFLLIIVGGHTVRMLIQGAVAVEELMILLMLTISTGLVMPGLMLPYIYKFGVEKGRLAYLLTLGGAAGLLAYFGTNGTMFQLAFEPPVGLTVAIAIAVYGVSCVISIGICRKKQI